MIKSRYAYMSGMSLLPIMGRMSPSEMRKGRYLRNSDDGGHGNGGGGGGASFDLPDSVDSLDSIPERLRPLYVKNEGSDKYSLDDVNALRGHLNNIKEENRKIKGQNANLRRFSDAGVTPEEIEEYRANKNKAEEERARKEGDWNALKSQMEENHRTALESSNTKIKNLSSRLERLLRDDAARTEMAREDIGGNPTLLLPAIRDRVEVKENDDGEWDVIVKREDGAPMLNSENKPATIRDLLLELRQKDEYKGAFNGINQSGGGAPSHQNGGGAPSGLKKSTMTLKQKTEFIQKFSLADYNKLPE